MPRYKIILEATNTFFIEAGTEEEASEEALSLGVFETLDGADIDVAQIDEVFDASV
jgi:hypothetical protein